MIAEISRIPAVSARERDVLAITSAEQRLRCPHDGVVSREQARACGLSEDQITRRLTNDTWQLSTEPATEFRILT